jgi:hypothetical protein
MIEIQLLVEFCATGYTHSVRRAKVKRDCAVLVVEYGGTYST